MRNRLQSAEAHASELHPSWDTSNVEGLHTILCNIMPGHWTPGHLTKLVNSINSVTVASHQGIEVPLAITKPEEIAALLQCVDFTQLTGVIDPWAGTSSIRTYLATHKIKVLENDINPEHKTAFQGDALQPSLYERIGAIMGVDAIVTSPWFALLDVAVPLSAMVARAVACIHVPAHYFTDPHPARAAFISHLIAEGRLHMLWNLAKGPLGRRCGWMLVFRTAALRQALVSPVHHQQAPFSFM